MTQTLTNQHANSKETVLFLHITICEQQTYYVYIFFLLKVQFVSTPGWVKCEQTQPLH